MLKKLKILFGFIFIYSGLFYIVRKVNCINGKVPILMYHSISNGHNYNEIPSCLSLCGMVVATSTFNKHMDFISKYYNVISIDEFVDNCRRKDKNKLKNSLIISFDDGFYDNYSNVFPVLKKYGFTAVVFLIGNTLSLKSMMWLHHLYKIIDKVETNTIKVSFAEYNNILSVTTVSKQATLKKMVNMVKSVPPQSREQFFHKLETDNNLNLQKDDYYLGTHEINKMLTQGITFGAHSMEHLPLTQLGPLELENEIAQSKALVREVTGQIAIPFAYPFGMKETWDNNAVIDCLRKNDLSCGLTTVEGLNDRDSNLYKLKRIEVGECTVYELVLHLTGIIGLAKTTAKKIIGLN